MGLVHRGIVRLLGLNQEGLLFLLQTQQHSHFQFDSCFISQNPFTTCYKLLTVFGNVVDGRVVLF